MQAEVFTLENGIRIVHYPVENHIAHCGIFIRAGSRDELEGESGLAHFIEHTIFKGTARRKSYHVLNRLESVGGDLNAFTTKEITCIYASFLNKFYERTLELMSDILFNSVFPQRELDKEKDVIIDEINSYRDTPSELIYDEFEELIFDGHALGKNILGNPEIIKSFTRKDIISFIERNYRPDQMVICSVGNISQHKLKRLVNKHYSGIHGKEGKKPANSTINYTPSQKTIEKNIFQTHCMLGNVAYSRKDPRRIPLSLLNNVLGGPGLNSRLNLIVREKYGYSYLIESVYQAYSDTGIWGVYVGTTNGSLNKTISLINKELIKLKTKKLGSVQLKNAKTQLIGQIAIHYESNLNKMLSIGKGCLMDNKITTIEDINKKIDEVTDTDVIEAANEIFNTDQLSTLIYQSA